MIVLIQSHNMDQNQQQQQSIPTMIVPIWAIVIIVLAIIVIIIAAFFYFRKRMTRSISVATIHEKGKEFIANKGIKKSPSLGSFQTLVTQQQKERSVSSEASQNNSYITTTPLPPIPSPPTNNKQQQSEKTSPSPYNSDKTNINNDNEKTDKHASLLDESEYSCSPPEPPQGIRVSLPLPPPSTSFFSDKMEVDSNDSQDFYDMYLRSKPKESNDVSGYISIDLNTSASTDAAGGATSFASNIQQKAATIKTSLYQSLRSKQKSINGGGRSSAQHLFSNTAGNNEQSKTSGESYGYQPTTVNTIEKTHTLLNSSNFIKNNSSTITTDSNKTVIDLKEAANNEFNNTTKQKLNNLTVTHNKSDTVAIDDELPITPKPNLQEPVRAAKRVIPSASGKSKTRSIVINDKDLSSNNGSSGELAGDDQQLSSGGSGDNKNSRKSSQGSIRFGSIRGPKNNGEYMTITSGSMRRLVRESILFDDESLPSIPSASSAAIVSTSNGTAKKSGASVVDIASWWESSNDNSDNITPKNLNLATNSANEKSDSNSYLPLYSNVTAGSNSSNTPHQYRASLSTSIFGTLSKSSGSAAPFDTKEESINATGGGGIIARHNSHRKGTISRSTLRNITANATSGVNRSIKGLFDHSSSSINKIVPDDSQKMELNSEPIQMAIEEKIPLDSQHQEQQQIKYNLIRQKSVRDSNNSRSNLPSASTHSPSESSAKYALSDDEYILDESSKKTAVDDVLEEPPMIGNKMKAKLKEKEAQYQQLKAADTLSLQNRDSAASNSGEVDVIRRMLQDTWNNNMKESGSLLSITSDADTIATTSTYQQSASVASNKLNRPRQQSQSLLTKSLLSQQVAKRASLVVRTGISTEDFGFVPQQGPQPSASFSSSTVRTMVPESSSNMDGGTSDPISIRQNAIISPTASSHVRSSINGSNKIQASSYDEKTGALSAASMLLNRLSTSPMDTTTTSSSPRNSSTESSRGHSRKSSGGNSAATALRISSGYAANVKTWSGRPQKRSSRPSVTQLMNDDDTTPSTPDSPSNFASTSEQYSIGRSSMSKRAFFSTMRKGQKTRGGIPWMMAEDDDDDDAGEERTPAQIERDRYLQGEY